MNHCALEWNMRTFVVLIVAIPLRHSCGNQGCTNKSFTPNVVYWQGCCNCSASMQTFGPQIDTQNASENLKNHITGENKNSRLSEDNFRRIIQEIFVVVLCNGAYVFATYYLIMSLLRGQIISRSGASGIVFSDFESFPNPLSGVRAEKKFLGIKFWL